VIGNHVFYIEDRGGLRGDNPDLIYIASTAINEQVIQLAER
jgi:hypothetical protein